MSWYFDEVDNYVTLADHSALTFPNGDWTVAGWIKLPSNAGTTFKYFLSWGTALAASSWHLYIGEASCSTSVLINKLHFIGQTASVDYANGANNPSTANVGAATTWQHVVIRFTQSTKTLQYFVNGSADASWVVSGSTGVIDRPDALYFGSRAVSPTDRYFLGRLAEFAKWDVALSAGDITNLAGGYAPSLVPTGLMWYTPMINDFSESVNGITVTAFNGAATDADHPSITYSLGTTIAPTKGALVLSGKTPTVSQSGSQSVAPTKGALVLDGKVPGVDATGALVLNPTKGALVLSGKTPTVSAVTIFNPVDRGTVNLSLSSVTPNGSTPTITIRNRFAGDVNAGGARLCFFSVSGVNGLTPVFDVERVNMENNIATAKFKWSYTGAMGSWTDFDTTTQVTTPNVYRSSNAAAFTQDTVYVAMNFPWRIAYTADWIATISGSAYVSEPPSSSGAGFVFHTRSATTNGATAGVGDAIPAQPLYSLKISSGGLAPDGTAKRKMVLMAGMHAAEDVGNYALQGAVEFLISADAQAATVRSWFDVFVYPMVASAGRAGGGQRLDFENANKLRDVNREWAGTLLETIEAHKTAIAADAGATVHVTFDFHGTHYEAAYDYHVGPTQATWTTAIRTYIPGHPISDLSGTAGTSAKWAVDNKGTEYAITPEHPYQTTLNMSSLLAYGANHMRAVAKLAADGEWGIVATTGHVVLSGKVPTVVANGSLSLTPSTGHLVASGKTPTVIEPVSVGPTTRHLALSGQTPSVLSGYVINPTTGAVIFTGKTPAVDQPREVFPETGHAILRGLVPAASGAGSTVIGPGRARVGPSTLRARNLRIGATTL